jgi:hypothetical protein
VRGRTELSFYSAGHGYHRCVPAQWRYRTAAAVLLLLVCGCASAASPDPGTTGAEPPPCRPEAGAPITERELKAALDAEGIRLLRERDCLGDELVRLSNLTEAVPYEQEDVIMASEGHIFCELYSEGSSRRIERFVWRNDPDPTYLDVLNVACAIYPEIDRQTDVLERALRRLPGVSDLPSTVPSEDAVRD